MRAFLQNLYFLWRYFGPHWLLYRFKYAAQRRTGYLARRLPAVHWSNKPLEQFLTNPKLSQPELYRDHRIQQAPAFFFKSSDKHRYESMLKAWDSSGLSPLRAANQLSQGVYTYFQQLEAFNGFPPDWHANPFTGQRAPANKHWSQIDDFSYGDIKVIWDLSRFSFVYTLVRSYWRTGNEVYPRLFWQLLEDWRTHNPPQVGANWKCGQEISFRLMAWLFGLYGFLLSLATTPERIAMLAQMVAVSGERIEAKFDYAISQKNNHGISEALGLWTIGLLFPEFRKAEHWRKLGKESLEKLGRELIYEDGSFAQHSMNYHRLMLHDYVWAVQLGAINGHVFSSQLKEKLAQATLFLFQVQDEVSGKVPCYGQNDGANILPLNNCDYQDFRPVLQASWYLCHAQRCYPNGLWDEDLLWLFGPESIDCPLKCPQRMNIEAKVGGYYTKRSKYGFVFVRCAQYKNRPGQADMLHLDLWWKGHNVLPDAGTYSYNAPPPWNDAFAHTPYHNTVSVDGADQMERVGKFLWLPWLSGRVNVNRKTQSGNIDYLEIEHDGYKRLTPSVVHRRGILRIANEGWLVLDKLGSKGDHNYRLHWLLADFPYVWFKGNHVIELQSPGGSYYLTAFVFNKAGNYSLVRADNSSPRGWRACYYNSLEPALSFELLYRGNDAVFITWMGAKAKLPNPERGNGLEIETDFCRASIKLRNGQDFSMALIESVETEGGTKESLSMV